MEPKSYGTTPTKFHAVASSLPALPSIPDYKDEELHPTESMIPPKTCSCCTTPSKPKWEIGENLSMVLFIAIVMLGVVVMVLSGHYPH